ncbi:MAG: lasso peptide isopeptide bond-forming cyclase [Timaviella obliquedivisa GSE-PSE-MK23-08B]|jgi:asparagine synthase (glutamine-hydrolysing)|nr:lasso peptide isopeptide bond-forming cyclase [Timaviella obliquedivisa GSE-PSE-MK23-08B]
MSGILGIYNLDNQSVKRQDLTRMADILTHRGRDGSGIWQEGAIGLGHRMLWTTPESLLEQLPLQSDGLVLTADARIDNREELIQSLELRNLPVEKITDSDLILSAYRQWGEDCAKYLLGDFAFAIWDQKNQQLFCARDHFGVKPFYYYASSQTWVFASEIKALFEVAIVPQHLNEERVADYLLTQFDDKEITFYQEVLRLPPAHCLTVRSTGGQVNAYWALDPEQTLQFETPEQYAQELQRIFAEAVRCRLRSALPVGAMLSGGLDSSSIACMAGRLIESDRHLSTFSAIFDDVPECDERAYINPVLEQGKFDPHYVYGDQVSPLVDIEQVLWHQDQPLFAYNLFLNWSLYRVAQAHHTRVILDGFDGDSTVSHGTSYLLELAQSCLWLRLYREIRGLNQNFDQQFRGTFKTLFWRYGVQPVIAKILPLRFLKRVGRAIDRKISSSKLSNTLSWTHAIHPNFIQRLNLEARRKNKPIPFPQKLSPAKAAHYYSLVRGVMPYTLEVLDHAAAAFSIELRFPFWDKRLVEFCLAIPPEQKMEQGWTRMIMRRAMAGILPDAVQWRRGKANLGSSFTYGLLTYERERLTELFLNTSQDSSTYLNQTNLQHSCERFINSNSQENDISSLWQALSLSLWMKEKGFGCNVADVTEA